MNPYQFPTTCSICGGEGYATARSIGYSYLGGTMAHSDPRICASIIRQRKEREEQKKKQEELVLSQGDHI